MKKNDFKKMTATEREEYARMYIQTLVNMMKEFILHDDFDILYQWRNELKNWITVYMNMRLMRGEIFIKIQYLVH